MIKTFNQVVKLLESYVPTPEQKHPGEFGLRRMQYLMDLLGNPQLAYPTIHVGGTSGKGSTATIIASILATKYKVGLHTSPHLEKITERIKILQRYKDTKIQRHKDTKKEREKDEISEKEFVALTNEIFLTIKKVEKSKLSKPSYFEVVTAMALLYFQKQKVDFAVIEVGMGGRYDASNVIKPLVAVLTNVGLDHTEVLGDTVEKIAEDKVGIVKSGVRVVSGVSQPTVRRIVKAIGTRQKAKVSLLGKDFSYKIKKVNSGGSIFDYSGDHTYKDLKLSLLGEHQVENTSLALRAIELLIIGNWQLVIGDIRKALRNVFIPGRLEIVKKNPLIILDGAHNPEKMKALVKGIKDIFHNSKVISILAIKSEKNAKEMLSLLLPICKKMILTKFKLTTDLGDTFSYDPEVLLDIVKSSHPEFIPPQRDPVQPAVISGSQMAGIPDQVRDDNNVLIQPKSCMIIEKPIEAIRRAQLISNSDDLILVTGSLYLVGEVRKELRIMK